MLVNRDQGTIVLYTRDKEGVVVKQFDISGPLKSTSKIKVTYGIHSISIKAVIGSILYCIKWFRDIITRLTV